MLGQLGEADVAVVGAVEQGADRRRLEENVRLVLGVQVAMPKGLEVQVAGEALVEHHDAVCGSTGAEGSARRCFAPPSIRRGRPRSGNGISTRSKSRGAIARSNVLTASASTAPTS